MQTSHRRRLENDSNDTTECELRAASYQGKVVGNSEVSPIALKKFNFKVGGHGQRRLTTTGYPCCAPSNLHIERVAVVLSSLTLPKFICATYRSGVFSFWKVSFRPSQTSQVDPYENGGTIIPLRSIYAVPRS